jgi:hypothetical protein
VTIRQEAGSRELDVQAQQRIAAMGAYEISCFVPEYSEKDQHLERQWNSRRHLRGA